MKVGIIVDNEFNFDVRVRKEAQILFNMGNSVYILCYSFGKIEYKPVNNLIIERIRISKKLKDILFFFFNLIPIYELLWTRSISKFISNNDIEVIHVHDLYLAKAARKGILRSKRSCKMILDLHENYPAAVKSYNWTKGFLRNLLSRPKVWERKEIDYINKADKLVVLSSYFKDTILKKKPALKADDIIVYPNVIDIERFRNFKIDLSKTKTKGTTLLYFGAVAERRGIFDTLHVFKNLIKQGRDLNLLIIGPCDKADKTRFQALISNPDIQEHVKYIPWIDISRLPTYLWISDICLAPFQKNDQHDSGIANKIFQYMFGKKPIVASDCRPQQNLIERYQCGLVFRNLKEFETSIQTLSEDKELARKMGLNGYNALQGDFSSEKIDRSLINLYHEIEG